MTFAKYLISNLFALLICGVICISSAFASPHSMIVSHKPLELKPFSFEKSYQTARAHWLPDYQAEITGSTATGGGGGGSETKTCEDISSTYKSSPNGDEICDKKTILGLDCYTNCRCPIGQTSCSYGCENYYASPCGSICKECTVCTALRNETGCAHGTESCSDDCAGTRTCCKAAPAHTHSYSCPSGYSASNSWGSSAQTANKSCSSCDATSGTCYKAPAHTHSYSCPSGYSASNSWGSSAQTANKSCSSCDATSGTCYKAPACNLPPCKEITSKPENSSFLNSLCTDCSGTKQIQSGWMCNEGYELASSQCVAILSDGEKCETLDFHTMDYWNARNPGDLKFDDSIKIEHEVLLPKLSAFFNSIFGIKEANATSMISMCDYCKTTGCKDKSCMTSCPSACMIPIKTYRFIISEYCPHDSNYVKGMWIENPTISPPIESRPDCGSLSAIKCSEIWYCCEPRFASCTYTEPSPVYPDGTVRYLCSIASIHVSR